MTGAGAGASGATAGAGASGAGASGSTTTLFSRGGALGTLEEEEEEEEEDAGEWVTTVSEIVTFMVKMVGVFRSDNFVRGFRSLLPTTVHASGHDHDHHVSCVSVV